MANLFTKSWRGTKKAVARRPEISRNTPCQNSPSFTAHACWAEADPSVQSQPFTRRNGHSVLHVTPIHRIKRKPSLAASAMTYIGSFERPDVSERVREVER